MDVALPSAQSVLDHNFLDVRCMLIEIAAAMDRYDRARIRDGAADDGMERIRAALELLAERTPPTPEDARSGPVSRAERLLLHFSDLDFDQH